MNTKEKNHSENVHIHKHKHSNLFCNIFSYTAESRKYTKGIKKKNKQTNL